MKCLREAFGCYKESYLKQEQYRKGRRGLGCREL